MRIVLGRRKFDKQVLVFSALFLALGGLATCRVDASEELGKLSLEKYLIEPVISVREEGVADYTAPSQRLRSGVAMQSALLGVRWKKDQQWSGFILLGSNRL